MEGATKRPPESAGDGDLGELRRKRARDVRDVAELTLALAAMVEMRGGGGPTVAERAMMAEAREKLVEMCGGFLPREVFPVNAFRAVMEDLGIDKVREQRELGFRPLAKLSIAEKLEYTKLKFERSEASSLHSATQSSHGLQTNMSAVAENRGKANTTKMFPSDKAKPAPVSSGVFHPILPPAHTSAANSTSLPYQLPANEERKPMVSSGLTNSLPGKVSSPSLSTVERPSFRLDQRPNGYVPQMQANVPGGHLRPTWSQHTQSASLAKPGAHNKVLPQNKLPGTVKAEGATHVPTSRMASQAAAPRPLITQTTSGLQPAMNQQMQRTNVAQTSLPNNTHNEISKIVQKFLQQYIRKRSAWNPPSRDYMNKTVTCQVCKMAVVEVENVLVCDACENGYHMKCLQTQDLKTIPRSEWHCFKCLALTDGKPLPPKYGRVTRNITAPKPAVPTPEKKTRISNDKASQQKLMANGSSGLQCSPAGSTNVSNSASNFNASNARAVQGTDSSVNRHIMTDKSHTGSRQNEHDILNVVTTPSRSSVEISLEGKLGSELEGKIPPKSSETVSPVLDHMQSCGYGQHNCLKVSPRRHGIPSKQCTDNCPDLKNLENFDISKSHDGNLNVDVKQEEKGVARLEFIENYVGHHALSSSDCSNVVDWIGDVAQVADEKTYYSSCCINGIVYKVLDYALFFCNNKLMPSKIQAMWEDNKTRLKWVIVNRCYFPGDLPEDVGHPCCLEGNEVYESNHGCTILTNLIQGPCEVLHPEKYIQESERRSRLGSKENGRLRPLFLCKWFYDELKGCFRDLSSLSQPDMVL